MKVLVAQVVSRVYSHFTCGVSDCLLDVLLHSPYWSAVYYNLATAVVSGPAVRRPSTHTSRESRRLEI